MEYGIMTTDQAATKWETPRSTVQWWCREGLVPGAFRAGRTWFIPADVTLDDIKRNPRGRPRKDKADE